MPKHEPFTGEVGEVFKANEDVFREAAKRLNELIAKAKTEGREFVYAKEITDTMNDCLGTEIKGDNFTGYGL